MYNRSEGDSGENMNPVSPACTAGLLKEDGPVRIYENHEITAAAVQHTGNNAG